MKPLHLLFLQCALNIEEIEEMRSGTESCVLGAPGPNLVSSGAGRGESMKFNKDAGESINSKGKQYLQRGVLE